MNGIIRLAAVSHPWLIGTIVGTVGVTTPLASTRDAGLPAAQPAVAQPPATPAADPPARVGRLSIIEGTVSYRPSDDTTWAAAEPNRAITTGDRLWADASSRAEVQVGDATLRVGNQTEADLVRLDDQAIQVRVPQGAVTMHVRSLDGGQTDEVDAPNAAVAFGAAGTYRVDVSPDGQTTTVTVRDGAAEVTAAGSSFSVEPGQAATVQGTDAPTYQVVDAAAPDDFEQWGTGRDAALDHSYAASQPYLPPNLPGAADLGDAGTWASETDYGPVWYPNAVQADWAPYHYGHWVWVGPWGWTWVDDAPWGFAPFHYGRWAYINSRWGWCPGTGFAHPVFAPALVAFVGGNGWGVSVGAGVGWFPLAPREVYYPGYHVSLGYVRQMNVTVVRNVTTITNVTNVTNMTYRNRGLPNAVVAVRQEDFAAGRPVSRVAVRVTAAQITSARLIGARPGIHPTAVSYVGQTAVERHAPLPPRALETRVVVANHAPHPAFAAKGTPLPVRSARVVTSHPLAAGTINANAHPAARQPAIRAASAPRPSVARPAVANRVTPSTPLDDQYHQALSTMEARHQQEFASPPKGETQQQLSTRQEAEHQDLQQRYQHAQNTGMKTLPPPKAAPRAAAPRSRGK